MESLPDALRALRDYSQFVLWKAVPSKKRPGKFDKFPCNIEGKISDAHDPSIWLDAETACLTSSMMGDEYGVGFVFTENDPFFFVDIDGAYDGTQWSKIATDLCNQFAGAAVEVSHSGRGLHIIGTGVPSVKTEDRRKKAVDPITGSKENLFDIYTESRFVALTGTGITGDVSCGHQKQLDVVINKYLKLSNGESRHSNSSNWTTTHNVDSRPHSDDEKLIEKALKTKSANSAFDKISNNISKASFKDLWENNNSSFPDIYPHDQIDGDYDTSAVDAALAQHLSFWTGGNCERIELLMRKSALVRRKWDYHKSYMSRTITGAVGRSTSFYNVGAPIELTDNSIIMAPKLKDGYQVLSADQQIELFDKCVYVAELNKIFTPNGATLKSEQFNAMYGGYDFMVDSNGDKTTKKAWEAFTESQCVAFPKADAFCFKPQSPTGSIIEADGWRYVNTYVPLNIVTIHGDITPFNIHLAKVLPDERDRTILLSYMAACIQYKGYKIQWAPLLQGVVGNGKTLFTRCVAYAIGERYTHMPPALEISEKFNAWLFNTLFIGVEDIYVPSNKLEMIETLKPMITNKRLARRAMNTDQSMHDICCNFMFNSNHKDGIKDATKDRRYCVFYSAQQEKVDLIRDGMTGDYFSKLYDWLDKHNGYAMVAHHLQNFAIPDEFNPTMSCQTAPTTTSTAEAANISMGNVEQEILEAIEEGRTGFAGGWVSSFALDKLIDNMRKNGQIPRNKRRDLMRSIGYDYHPNLKGGRVDNVIMIDNGKPRLYIKDGHIHTNLTSGAEIARHYCSAQGDVLAKISVDNAVKS